MKLDIVCNKNDECYTPKYAIKPIIPFCKPFKRIWCPFDNEQSNFVKLLKQHGHIVIHGHIENGKDFFKYKPALYDAIISNPPYSLKNEVFERLFKLKKPFAMLTGIVGLFESQKRFYLFASNKFEIMLFNKRICYLQSYEDIVPKLNPPFSSAYICHNILPTSFVFRSIDKLDV